MLQNLPKTYYYDDDIDFKVYYIKLTYIYYNYNSFEILRQHTQLNNIILCEQIINLQ